MGAVTTTRSSSSSSMPWLLVLALCQVCVGAAAVIPRHIGKFQLEEASFVSLVPAASSSKFPTLVVTQFSGNPFKSGSIYTVPEIGKNLSNIASVQPRKVASGLKWPNEVTAVPARGTLLARGGFVFGDGFLPPFKRTGSVSYMEPSTGGDFDVHQLTAPKNGWYYHLALWLDVNQDGLLDLVTARANADKEGEMIWLEHPGDGKTFPWKEHHIADGPDVSFDIVALNATSTPALVYCAEFFGKKLTVLRLEQDGTVSSQATIDDTIGAVYDVKATSLAGSDDAPLSLGEFPMQLVVTNYSYEDAGALMFYDIPKSQPVGGDYTRTTVYGHFKNRQYMIGSGAPGFVAPHTPGPKSGVKQQNIFVCGDGAEELFLFTPQNNTAASNAYEMAWSEYYGATVGGIVVGDADLDGWNEVFVCDYDNGFVDVFTYQGAH